jgi:peptidoglycan lytic transglycosylase
MKVCLLTVVIGLGIGIALLDAAEATTGLCSFYSTKLNGRRTASGEKFDSNALTAAHRTYPMGTKLKLTNPDNNKSVVVKVNDRGPYVKDREISVTRRAARDLGLIKQGVGKVNIEQVQ